VKALSPKDASLMFSYLACPINLQLESYYARLLLLSKKRYLTYSANGEGKIIGKGEKGTITVRREQCAFVKGIYKSMYVSMLEKESKEKIIEALLKRNRELCSGMVKDAEFIMYKGIANVLSYAKTDKTGLYIDREGKPIPNVTSPIDPRLVYANMNHTNLARKMIKRGDDVVANTRMEFLFCDIPTATCESDRAEDYEFFRENKSMGNLKIDYFYYQRQLLKPISELLSVKYPGKPIIYEPLEEAIDREFSRQDKMARFETNQLPPKFKRKSDRRPDLVPLIGWKALGLKPSYERIRPWVYEYKGKRAKYQNILESIKKGEEQESYLQEKEAKVLKQYVLRWKSRDLLRILHKKFASGIRKYHQPSNRNNKLKVTTGGEQNYVMLRKKKGKYKRKTIVKLLECEEIEEGDYGVAIEVKGKKVSKKKPVPVYTYKAEAPDGKILEGLMREDLAPFYLKDQFMMKDIHKAHKAVKEVCDEIKEVMGEYRRLLDCLQTKTKIIWKK
jgi:hypothetical protein